MYGYIYKFTFLPTNDGYVGKHKYTISLNLDESYGGSGLKGKKLLSQYNKSEGPSLVKREIIEGCETGEQLNSREIYGIDKLNAINEGLNISSGGDGGWDYVNSIVSKEDKVRAGKLGNNSFINKLQNDPDFLSEFSLKVSNGLKKSDVFHSAMAKLAKTRKENGTFAGKNNPMYGHIYTDETRKKMSNSNLGEKNSQFGTHGMKKDGCKSIKVKNDDVSYYESLGYVKGR